MISGHLEVILDRQLAQDDWRGLGEGIADNLPAFSQFVLLFELVNKRFMSEVSYWHSVLCYWVLLADCSNNAFYATVVSVPG